MNFPKDDRPAPSAPKDRGGRPRQVREGGQVSAWVPKHVRDLLQQAADERSVSLSSIARRALEEWAARRGPVVRAKKKKLLMRKANAGQGEKGQRVRTFWF